MCHLRQKEEQGWRIQWGGCLSKPIWFRFEYWTLHHMWVEYVFCSRPCSEDLSPGPFKQANTSEFKFDLDTSERYF